MQYCTVLHYTALHHIAKNNPSCVCVYERLCVSQCACVYLCLSVRLLLHCPKPYCFLRQRINCVSKAAELIIEQTPFLPPHFSISPFCSPPLPFLSLPPPSLPSFLPFLPSYPILPLPSFLPSPLTHSLTLSSSLTSFPYFEPVTCMPTVRVLGPSSST